MRHLFGIAFTLLACGLIYTARSQRSRRLAARRAAGIADRAEPTSRMFVFGDIMRPMILCFVAYLGIKTTLAYFWLDAGRWLSYFDLGAFLAALAAYGYWVWVKTRIPPVEAFRGSAEAGAPAPAEAVAAANDAEAPASRESRAAA